MARPTNSGESNMANEDFNVMNFPPSPPFLPTLSSVPPPSPPMYFPTSSNSMVVYPRPRSPSSSNSMVVYQGSSQSAIDNPLQNQQQQPRTPAALPISRTNPYAGISQRPTNSGDQSDMATDEHFDVTSLLNLPQWSPPSSPCSSANSMLLYQRSSQSFMDFVDRPLYIAGDLALTRQELLQFWTDASEKRGPRGGIMSMSLLENLPQSLECLGVNLLHLYVEDEFDTLLYWQDWQGESSWEQLCVYLREALPTVLQGEKSVWECWCDDLERKDYAQVLFATARVSIGVRQKGPREWVAKIRYQRRFLELSQFFVRVCDRDRYDSQEANNRVVFEDAQRDFPNLFQDFLHVVPAAQGKDRAEDAIDYLLKTNSWQFNFGLLLMDPDPHEDFVNGEVEPVRIEGEGTGEAEIAESQLNPGPSRKRQRKEKTPTGERGTKKITRVKNVIPLDKILQVKEMCLKSAAELLKVSRYALKRACRNYGINRWPPRNEHKTFAVVDQEGIPEPSENSCNDEVEAVGIGVVGSGKGEVKEGKLNCGSSDIGERNEKTPQGERANNKTTGVRIEIPLKEILKYKKMCRKEAATHLQVSISTLKRVCRGYKIYRWPPRNEHKLIGQSRPNESPAVEDQERNPQKNSTTLLPSNEESASMDSNSVTVKARYEGHTFKFQLSKKPWGMAELEEQVKKRLQLETQIKYKDEDGDLISIVCDDDLQECILSSRSQGTTSIVLLLEQKGSR